MRERRVLKFLVLIFLFSLLSEGGNAENTGVLSLTDCIKIALKNNPQIGIARENYKKTESGLLRSYGYLLPRFTLDFYTGHRFYGPSSIQYDAQGRPVRREGFDYEDYTFRFSSDIVLFDGGSSINNIRSSMKSRDAAREEYEYNRDMITAQVIRAYYNLVRARMLLHVQEESVESANRNLEKAKALHEVGSATRADVLKAKVRYSNTRLSMIQAKNNVKLAEEELLSLLNIREGIEVVVDTTMTVEFAEPDLKREIQFALRNRPDLKSLRYSMESAQAQISAAKGGWMPTLGASFSYGWNDRQMAENLNFFKDEYMWAITGYFSFNIFDRFNTSANVQTAKANYRIAEYNLEKARLDAIREIKSLVMTMEQAWERINVAQETVEQAREDLKLAEERYRVGAGTMLEVIDAQVALTQAKADVIEAKCDYLIARADLARATGRRLYD